MGDLIRVFLLELFWAIGVGSMEGISGSAGVDDCIRCLST